MFNLQQLLISTTLETWHTATPAPKAASINAKILAALTASTRPLTTQELHEDHGCANSIESCTGAVSSLLQAKRIVRVRLKRPYTYTVPGR